MSLLFALSTPHKNHQWRLQTSWEIQSRFPSLWSTRMSSSGLRRCCGNRKISRNQIQWKWMKTRHKKSWTVLLEKRWKVKKDWTPYGLPGKSHRQAPDRLRRQRKVRIGTAWWRARTYRANVTEIFLKCVVIKKLTRLLANMLHTVRRIRERHEETQSKK